MGARRAPIEGVRNLRLDAVCEARLLEQADREQDQADKTDAYRMPSPSRSNWGHVLVVEDRPRDQLRENMYEQREVQQLVRLDLAAIGVHEVRNLVNV